MMLLGTGTEWIVVTRECVLGRHARPKSDVAADLAIAAVVDTPDPRDITLADVVISPNLVRDPMLEGVLLAPSTAR